MSWLGRHLRLYCTFEFLRFRRGIVEDCGSGYLNPYSDWLWAGRYGDRIAVGARFSAPVQTVPGAHLASCTTGTGCFPGVKSGRGVTLTPHPRLVPRSWKGRAIPLLPPMGRTACTERQCLYKGELYLTYITMDGSKKVEIVGKYTFFCGTVQSCSYKRFGKRPASWR